MTQKTKLFSFVPKVQNMESFPVVQCFRSIASFVWYTSLFTFTPAFSVILITKHQNTMMFINNFQFSVNSTNVNFV